MENPFLAIQNELGELRITISALSDELSKLNTQHRTDPTELLTVNEITEKCKMCRATFYKHAKLQGLLNHKIKVGKKTCFLRSHVESFIKSLAQNSK